MRRRDLLLTALAVPWLSAPVRSQAPERVWRVSVLTPSRSGERTIRQFTLPELAKLGFEEGRNLTYQVFSADDAPERLPALAAELVATKPDAIIAVHPGGTRGLPVASQLEIDPAYREARPAFPAPLYLARSMEPSMAYRITFYKDDAELGSTPWGQSRESAIQHAKDHFQIHSKQSGATSVVVKDDNGKVIFQHPQQHSGDGSGRQS